MRHAIARTLARATSTLTHETPISHLQRSPYVCATCRATQQHRIKQHQSPKRSFTSSRVHHQPQPPQTHYDFFPQTFPSGPPPKAPFNPDLRLLRQEYLMLQSQAHPDLAPTDRKAHFEALSSRINEAYKTLQDPLRRAQYLLAQQGIDVEDDGAKLSDNALLVEVMEAREAVEEVENEEELTELREENNKRIETSVQMLDEAFTNGNLETAAQEAIRLRYWVNIDHSIQGWERGKGGGIIHH